MPVFGDQKIVAVEFDLNEDYGSTWLYGKFCYWICGTMIGNYDMGESLNVVLSPFTRVVKDNGNRDGGSLFDLPARDICARLNAGLSGADADIEERATEEQWARFDLSLYMDIFDDWRVYLVERGRDARYIVERPSSDALHEYCVPAGSFDGPSREAFDALNLLFEAGVGKVSQ